MRFDLISIIIPVYNASETIEKAIASILEQTYKNYEIILVDDGSSDNTYEICKSFKLPNLQVIKQSNAGPSVARNTGIDHAKGKYICFLDADDYYAPNYLEELYSCIYDADISVCGFTTNYQGLIRDINNNKCDETIPSDLASIYMLRNNSVRGFIWNKMFKKSIIDQNNIRFNPSIFVGEDLLFSLKYLSFCSLATINKLALYNYTIDDKSLSHKHDYKAITLLDAYYNAFNLFESFEYKRTILIDYVSHYLSYYELFEDREILENNYYKKIKALKPARLHIIRALPLNYKIKWLLYLLNKRIYIAFMSMYRSINYLF